jgi:uncharacterized protein YjdB
MGRATLAIPMLPILCAGIALLLSTLPLPARAAEPTTDVVVVKYASDGVTVLGETTVTHGWMETNLPVYGDGVTHYFHQGPVFDSPPGPWDENETANLKDKGAVKGTDVRDLCDLVGGMSAGDEIKIRASDGFCKWFGYENVYSPPSRQGPMVLCWYRGGDYVPGYGDGMQIIFFAGDNVFGNRDMHECMAPEYRYNYSEVYPSTNGLSVRYVSEIAVYSMLEPPELRSIEVSPADVALDIGETQRFTGAAYDQYGSEMSDTVFMWTSSDETVGKIDDTGLFTAFAAGGTAITAGNGTVAGMAGVTVKNPAPATTPTLTPTPDPVLTTIVVSPARVTLNLGEMQRFTGVAYDQDHREILGVDFAWTSGNETVGTIDITGFFTAFSAGATTVRAEAEGMVGAADVTVSCPEPVYTPTPAPMPTLTPAPVPAETPPADVAPASVASSPSATPPAPRATPGSTGFKSPESGAIFAIIMLLAVAYAIKRRKT